MLMRDASTFVDQDRFGASGNPPGERGNCFQVCMAALLGLPLAEVPHFYDTDEPVEIQQAAIQRWLHQRGWFWFCLGWDWVRDQIKAETPPFPRHALLIVSGTSPRGNWAHAVIGRVHATGWELVHDPHPSKAGIVGEPHYVEIIAPLPFIVGRR